MVHQHNIGERVELAGGRSCSEVGVLHTLLLVVVGGVVFFASIYCLQTAKCLLLLTLFRGSLIMSLNIDSVGALWRNLGVESCGSCEGNYSDKARTA